MNIAVHQPRPRIGVAEFVEMIAPYPDEERWELLEGEPVLMSPQTERHQVLVGNIFVRCRQLAKARGCVALPGLGLLSDKVNDYAPIPDVVVRCGDPVAGGYAKDPVLVAEVLSPSTMHWDRGGKLRFYQSIPTLEAILIVYQDEVRIEAWLRDGGTWRREVRQGPAASLDLSALGGTLALSDVYDGIPLGE